MAIFGVKVFFILKKKVIFCVNETFLFEIQKNKTPDVKKKMGSYPLLGLHYARHSFVSSLPNSVHIKRATKMLNAVKSQKRWTKAEKKI